MAESQARQLMLHKIYLKDASLEVPQAPQIFQKQWKPQVDVNLRTQTKTLSKQEGHFHVVLTVTVTATLEEEVGLLVEVQQAGIFQLTGFTEQELAQVLNTHCPSVLFPYAREAVSDIAQRGGFPQLLLQPVNFDALYQEHVAAQQKEGAEPKSVQ